MKTKILIVLFISIILMTISSCGISQKEYDDLLAENINLETVIEEKTAEIAQYQETINSLQKDIENQKPKYFENRTSITKWLDSVPKLGISADASKWYEYGIYYQRKALEYGYIISVAYYLNSGEDITVWCEVVTEDGWIYYFDPDNPAELLDTYMRIDMDEIELIDTGDYYYR